MRRAQTCSRLLTAAFVLLVAGFVPTPMYAGGDTCTWDGSTGSWNDGARWSCGHEPGAGDTAIINSGTVDLTAAASADVLNFNGGTLQGDGDLQVTVSFTWAGGTMGGSGKTTIPQGVTLSFTGGNVTTLGRLVENAGTATWSGTRNIQGAGTFSNLSTGTFTIQNDEAFGGSNITLSNAGMLIKTGGTGETEFNGTFTQSASGSVDVQSGTIRFDNTTMLDGTVTATGTTIRFDAGASTVLSTATLAVTNLSCTGANVTFELGGPNFNVTNLLHSSGTETYNGASISVPNLTLSGGTLQGSADIEVTSQFTWSAGTMGGSGKTTIPQGVTLSFTGVNVTTLSRAVDIAGSATWSGTRNIGGVGPITNLSTGTFTIQNDEVLSNSNAVFINNGILIKAGGVGQTEFNGTFTQSASGSLDVQSGTIRFDSDTTVDGSVTANGTTVQFNQGISTFADAVEIDVDNLVVSGGAVDMSNITDLTLNNVSQSNGTFTLDHPGVVVLGDFVRSGGTLAPGKGRIIFSAAETQNLSLSDPTEFFYLEISPGTTLVETNATDHATVSGFLRNRGTIRKTREISASGTVSFGLTDIELNIVDAGSLTSMQVDRIWGDHPNSVPPTMPDFYWQLTPTGGGATADVTLYHCYQPDTEALLCRWTGASWDCGNDFSTQMSITRTNVTQFGDWSAGAADPYQFMTAFECGNVSAWSDVRGLC